MLFVYEAEIYELNLSIKIWILFGVILFIIIFLVVCLSLQPKTSTSATFKVPLVPLIPFLSVFANTYLMTHLSDKTWYRFILWMALGFIIYFSYGIVKSVGYLTQVEKDRLEINSIAEPQDFSDIIPEDNISDRK